MTLFRTLLATAIVVGLSGGPAMAGQARDAERAFDATQKGKSMPLPKIEKRVMPFTGGADYLGPEFNGETYRLKFMRNGKVFWIDVDAQTGKIKGRSR